MNPVFCPRRNRGFTLLEMLITLMIVSLVAGIVWQAMGQLARVERLLEQGQMQSLAQAVRGEWLRSAFASLLPGTAQTHDRFQGSSTELSGLSAEAPVWPVPGLAFFRLRLEYDAVSNTTALRVSGEATLPDMAPDAYITLLSWPGRDGKLSYLDEGGQWQDAWPPSGLAKTAPALPRAILLETGIQAMRLVLATTLASSLQMPARIQLESM
jgi:prepilin-type N-terminal cleavage/methylation domain-containing protein